MRRVSASVAARSRELLDSHFDEWQTIRESVSRPALGWVRTIREALGMSAAVLAERLSITPGSVIRLEQSEANERIRLNTLRRAADALGCDLVYLLVPRQPLAETRRKRAARLATEIAAATDRTMALEDQSVRSRELDAAQIAERLSGGKIW